MIDLFSQKLGTPEGKEKIAEFGGEYIQDRLREVSFARKIIPPKMVTKADLQRSTHHDTLVRVVDIEPQSQAMAITFRGQPRARYVSGERYEIPFFTISSEKFEKTEQELLAYEMPITKIIEDNSVTDIQEVEDREFLGHVEMAIQELQFRANASVVTGLSAGTLANSEVIESQIIKGELARTREDAAGNPLDDWVVNPVQRPDFINLFKILSGGANGAGNGRLRMEVILLTEPDFEDILQWTIEDVGDKIQSETLVDGYKYNILLGKRFVRSIKVDILRVGNIYGFTAPNFLGRFYILNNTKFYIDKIANLITWQSWEDIGMGLGNIAAMAKLELFSASVTVRGTTVTQLGARTGAGPTFSDAAIVGLTSANKRISAEESLGAMNNLVEAGLYYPQVAQY